METDSDYPDLLSIPFGSRTTSNRDNSNSTAKGRKHPFLQRSDSTLCLGCPSVDPFDTVMSEALPLADQPHLLQPHSKREDLFGMPRPTISGAPGSSTLEGLPTRLGLSTRGAESQLSSSRLMLGHTLEQMAKHHSNANANTERRSNAPGPSGAGEPGPSKYNVSFLR